MTADGPVADPAAEGAGVSGEVSDLSFEDAMAALEGIVSQLESGRVDLEKSIALYERGAALRLHCEQLLRQAEMRVEQIVKKDDGSVSAEARDFSDRG